MKKRLLSLTLIAALCMSLLPVTALAAEEHNSHSNSWTELTADTTILSDGSYYLSGDVEYSGTEITVSGEVILCLNGHKLNLNKQHISVGSGASLTLCDCSTGGVLTGGSGSKGGGVYVGGGGTFTMTGGSIAGNTAESGGGVYVDEGGTFTMEDGSINNNQVTSGGGGGVMVNKGSFTLSGGSITGNATSDATYGYGGGVCLYGTFNLSGDAIIQNNTKDGTADNLYLGWNTINITGPLGENARIGVTAEGVPRSFISGWSDNMAGENPADYFSSDSDALGIGLNTAGDAVLGSQCTTITLNPNGGTLPVYSLVEGAALPIPTKTGYTFAGWYENPEVSGNPVTDIPTNSIENLNFDAKWTANTYTVTFDANGGSVSQTSAVTVAGKLTSLPTPTYDGYNFLGWFTQKDGGDKVTTETVFTVDSTIYAHWQNIPVTGVKLDKTSLTMQETGGDTLTATVEPDNATNKNVNWESSDTSIATVDANGKVTAVKEGSATITATAADGSGKSASCAVTVTEKSVYSISASPATLNFGSIYDDQAAPAAQMVTITNTGNQPVTLTQPTADNYVIGTLSATTLEPNATATFTVQPKAGLSAGTYNESLAISGSNDASAEIALTFTVNDRPTIPPVTPPSVSEETIDAILDAEPGETVSVALEDGDTTLDAEVFETLAGQDITLEIALEGGVTWTVNGTDIPADANLSDLDLGVEMDSDGIPVDVVNSITGERGTVQMTFAHDGDFGFTMTLTAPLGAENSGYWANLYHYKVNGGEADREDPLGDDEADKQLSFETAARIDDNGNAALPLSHASQYAIVIDDHSHAGSELPFTDVRTDDWFYDPVCCVYEMGLMTGVSDTAFAPNTTTTRGMVAAMLHRLEDSPTAENAGFSDVHDGDWYATAVNWAAGVGIVGGFGDGTFQPNAAITREQMASILYRYAAYKGMDVSARATLDGYIDQPSAWAEDVMQWAVAEGLLTGVSEDRLQPQGPATRAQVAAIFERFLKNIH